MEKYLFIYEKKSVEYNLWVIQNGDSSYLLILSCTRLFLALLILV